MRLTQGMILETLVKKNLYNSTCQQGCDNNRVARNHKTSVTPALSSFTLTPLELQSMMGNSRLFPSCKIFPRLGF